MSTLAEHKIVKIMADYASEPTWDKDGHNADVGELPVPYAIRQLLSAWVNYYDSQCTDYDPSLPDRFLLREFSLIGYHLATMVKKELPDWEVWYHDESVGLCLEVSPNQPQT